MTGATCGYCGERLEVPATGRPPKFCSDAHRKAFARDGGPRRPATNEVGADQLGTYVRKLDQRPSYRDIADGDPCPQDAGHGRMFMLAKERGAAAVQFCAHSAHQGRPIYAYDGVTPVQASRSGHGAVGASRGLSEAPHSASSPLEPAVAGSPKPRPTGARGRGVQAEPASLRAPGEALRPGPGGPSSDTHERPGAEPLGVGPARSAAAPGLTAPAAAGGQADGDPAGSGRAIAGPPASPGRSQLPASSRPRVGAAEQQSLFGG